MIVSIHQPNYLPWSGFFHKMSRSEVFVLLDSVPFSKNSYQNRCRIKTPQGPAWLTVPVATKGRFGQSTCEVPISPGVPWGRKHLRTLEQNYRRAPHFDALRDLVAPVYERPWERLADMTVELIHRVAAFLSIEARLVRAGELGVEGTGSELLLALCRKLGASRYLSGPTGRTYLDEKIFREAGIEVAYHAFEHPEHAQEHGEFVAGLSIVDLIASMGQESRAVLDGA